MKTQKILLGTLLVVPLWVQAQSVKLTFVPPPGSGGSIGGEVKGVDTSTNGIATFIRVFGTWWTKSTFQTPIALIQSDGTFTVNITTGGQDACADTVAVYVVPLDTDPYSIQANGSGSIPALLDKIAFAQVTVSKSSAQTIMFAGREWTLKDTGGCFWGPGPNYFSGKHALVDNEGRLHLKIAYTNGAWRCAEVILNESLGYGAYTFVLDSDIRKFPNPIVVGFFTYSDDVDYYHREIDVEFSNGDVVGTPVNWQFVVQPYGYLSGELISNGYLRLHRFMAPLNMTSSTHTFTWMSRMVLFKSYFGNPKIVDSGRYVMDYTIQRSVIGHAEFYPPPDSANWIGTLRVTSPTNITIADRSDYGDNPVYYRAWLANLFEASDPAPFEVWSTSSGIPKAGNEKVHINIWLFNAIPPGQEGEEYEIIVKDFKFEPKSIDFDRLQPKLKMLEAMPPPSYSKKILLTYPAE